MPETKLVCPECGVDMSGKDPIAHALTHWNEYLDPARAGKEAFKRQKATQNGGVSQAEYDKAHAEVK